MSKSQERMLEKGKARVVAKLTGDQEFQHIETDLINLRLKLAPRRSPSTAGARGDRLNLLRGLAVLFVVLRPGLGVSLAIRVHHAKGILQRARRKLGLSVSVAV